MAGGGAAGGASDAGAFVNVQVWYVPTPNGTVNVPAELVAFRETVALLGTRASAFGLATYFALPSLDGGLYAAELFNGIADEVAGSIAVSSDGGLFATYTSNPASPGSMTAVKVTDFFNVPSARADFTASGPGRLRGLFSKGNTVGVSGAWWDLGTLPGPARMFGGSGGHYAFLQTFDQTLDAGAVRWVGCTNEVVELGGALQHQGHSCLVFESRCPTLGVYLDAQTTATYDAGSGTFSLCELTDGGLPMLNRLSSQPADHPAVVAESNRAWVAISEPSRYVLAAFSPPSNTVTSMPVSPLVGQVKAVSGLNDSTALVGGLLDGTTTLGGQTTTPTGTDGFVILHAGAQPAFADSVLLTGPGNETIEAVAFGRDGAIWVAGTFASGAALGGRPLTGSGAFIARFTR